MRRGPPLLLPTLRGVFKYHRLHNEYKTHCTTRTLSTVSSWDLTNVYTVAVNIHWVLLAEILLSTIRNGAWEDLPRGFIMLTSRKITYTLNSLEGYVIFRILIL